MFGTVQLVFDLSQTTDKDGELIKALNLETVIAVNGIVRERPEEMKNKSMKSGDIEVLVDKWHMLNPSATPPYDIRADKLANEELRLKYRFLDMRRPSLIHNLRVRSQVTHVARNYFVDRGFLEVETPTLFRKTVESGAKEFLVPTRHIGKFYALPQSPQQYKQLLMAGGIDKYFQIARCYRDEGTKPDRQPEFTQIDLEMAFCTPDNIYDVIENLLVKIWRETLNISIPTPFPRMKFSEAMSRFGVDKPDTRYGLEITDISQYFHGSTINIFKKAIESKETIKALNIKKLSNAISHKELDSINDEAKIAGSKGIITVQVKNGEWKSSISKYLTPAERDQLTSTLQVEDGDLLIIAIGPHLPTCGVLGRLRIHCANMCKSKGLLTVPANNFNFLWVVDFPLFSLEPDLCSTHHPFTAPLDEDISLLESSNLDDLLKIRGLHYDVVVNGVELGGGSIRVHNHELQRKIFEKLNFPYEGIQQFNHLLEALKYGCPPHGGIALGLDRMISLLCNATSLREVIAFPKTQSGNELLTNSPSEITKQELTEFGLTYLSK